ncbi:dienelactone hydrolase family protein [Pedobacter sp. N36a]|uniref:alpha/beta hydrolase n=1 Tax=Pedobacter sp. N36a TaxID=2767996 RepID=UPI0016570158|nr:dienelactone hydrolase family protein [Pedobacter sp. N36a]MBC8984416.1 dienelactone hydrolase family protein [Pedobacter sp. N36a]
MYIHHKNIITAGLPVDSAAKAIIFLHGRGASAAEILSLNQHLQVNDAALFAPQATNHSWYPYSFMAPVTENQPALDSALSVLKALVEEIEAQGIPQNKIFFVGFSQGACLTLEYVSRNAGRYGGVVAFTGGLIGDQLDLSNYSGDFNQTPILISTGDPDPHVPVSRVNESKKILEEMNAQVTVSIYPGRVHTISKAELELARTLVFQITNS